MRYHVPQPTKDEKLCRCAVVCPDVSIPRISQVMQDSCRGFARLAAGFVCRFYTGTTSLANLRPVLSHPAQMHRRERVHCRQCGETKPADMFYQARVGAMFQAVLC